ncbi:uncharacterized protein LOC108051561 [Drosophila rhopaloa]|uniref:2-hydroxyacylsphingosine 1-beta-galactosyltransferase-like n=1 Tax=Drosophila rhopaloa TaxID=1041015 RepID=A0ABM5J7U3_DRORH|nr:uncharacterized protein LOC108051561 [Drosophila rhopaloa]
MRFTSVWPVLVVCLFLHLNLSRDLAQAANILGIFPFHCPSPFLVVRPLIQALLNRGHNVTLITPEGMLTDLKGARHIRIPKLNEHMQEIIESDRILDFLINKWTEGTLAATMYFHMSQDILSDDAVQRMLQDQSEKFDLIMIEASNLDALYGLVEHYNATLVGLNSLGVNWFTEELAGNPAPSIYEPISHLGYSRDHSLTSRFYNWIHIIEEKLLENLIVLPAQLRLFKKFFGYSDQKFYDLRNRFSVILVNNHFSMGKVRSNVPNLIEVGGLHLSEPPEPSDENLQRFMDEAEHGVIYFSMGLDIMVKFLPENIQQTLIKSFAKLKQRIVWKTEYLNMSNKSDHIYVIEKAPQRHVLAHPNVRLFITNGGLLSVMEAVSSGVPMLGLPIFFDQFGNLRWAQAAGIAKVLDINTLNADTLTSNIRLVIENSKYALRAKDMSNTFRDRPLSPLDTAVWWTEYALRNRDITHIRLNAEEIPILQYYRIDSILTFGFRLGVIAGSVLFLGWSLIKRNPVSRFKQSFLDQLLQTELRHERTEIVTMRLGFHWIALSLVLLLQQDLHQDTAQAAHILGIFSYHLSSHFLVLQPLVKALVKRGHNVTLITPELMPPDIDGVRHIRIAKLNKRVQEMVESDQLLDYFGNKWMESVLAVTMLFNMSQDILRDDAVQKMLQDKREHFDLVMMEPSGLEALYGLVEYYNASLMGLSGGIVSWNTEELAGNPAPNIYEPISHVGYSRDHTLVSRLYNWIHITEEMLLERLIIRPAQLSIFKKFFGYSEQKFYELRHRYSVILVNNHFSMGRVRANVPNIIEVGGLHLSEPPEPCEDDLQRFMDEALHGVIYFSMGLDIMVQFLPENMQQPLMQSFAKLKQRVIWKNEFFNMPNKSDNIYVIEKAPQRHILNHPKVVLFITNGGLLSVMEAVDSGVPMLGLPLFFDQYINLQYVRQAGMAEILDSNALNTEILTNTIEEILQNPEYDMNARKMSHTFRDRPMSPLDTAVWWTEYVLRNKDATHMRLKTEEISLMRYYRLDWLLPFGLRFGIVFGSVIFLIFKMFQKSRERQRRRQEREVTFTQISLAGSRLQIH